MLHLFASGVEVLVDELGLGAVPAVTIDAPQPPAANLGIGIASPRKNSDTATAHGDRGLVVAGMGPATGEGGALRDRRVCFGGALDNVPW